MSWAKVLIVDNETKFQRTVYTFLRMYDYTVLSAFNSTEGLAMVHKEHPDIILIDVALPHKDGNAMFRELQRDTSTHGIPVILLYEKGQAGNQSQQDSTDYVFKSGRLVDLEKKIRSVLNTSVYKKTAGYVEEV